MKEDRIRIKIAEACGWDCDPVCAREWKSRGQWARRIEWAKDNLVSLRMSVPDYLNDLNAMFGAFATLGRHWEISQVHDGYYCRIQFGPRNKDVVAAGLELAPVMAEAFLKTLNKWEES